MHAHFFVLTPNQFFSQTLRMDDVLHMKENPFEAPKTESKPDERVALFIESLSLVCVLVFCFFTLVCEVLPYLPQ